MACLRWTVIGISVSLLAACGMHPVRPYQRSSLAKAAVAARQDGMLAEQRVRELNGQEAARDARHDDVAARR
jgi:hypothetical protein